jgi:uncharacterized protein YeaO (DUF488 family)
MEVAVKRVYEPRDRSDGTCVLVDRLWPRGVSRATLEDVRWMREVAPSDELRTWYGHDPERWAEFARRYRAELRQAERRRALAELRTLAGKGRLTLLTATRDVERSAAEVLRSVLSR